MGLKVTSDNLEELEDFLRSRQNKFVDWYIFAHDEGYVELDNHDVWIKIPQSCSRLFALWSNGLQRFVNDNDILKVNPNLLKNLNGMPRLFKDCRVKLTSSHFDLNNHNGFHAAKAFEGTRFKGEVRDVSITSDALDATRMFANSDVEVVSFIDTKFIDMTELFLECELGTVLFKNCKCTDVLAEDMRCRDIFTDSMIKKIVFVDCESKLIDSIMYILNGNDEFNNVEVYIKERKKS